MTNIITTLKSMSEEDRKVYCHLRMTLHRAYLWAIEQTIGIAKMDMEDDVFLDALDIKLNMLMRRAGRSHSKDTPINDPFEVVSRSVESEHKQTENNSISKATADVMLSTDSDGRPRPVDKLKEAAEFQERLIKESLAHAASKIRSHSDQWPVEKVSQQTTHAASGDQINLKSLERAISQENTNV